MGYVFISYSTADQDYVYRLEAHLRSNDIDVWIDHQDMHGGQGLNKTIIEGIYNCHAFLFVVSTNSEASKWVPQEVAYAQSLDKPMFPLMLEGNPQTSEFALILAYLKYDDVRSGNMISDGTLARIRVVCGTSTGHGSNCAEVSPPEPLPVKPQPAAPPQAETPLRTVLMPSEKLMPAPFGWIEIPDKDYSIGKYPVTNAQFARFIEAGGYETQKWWPKVGWQHRKTNDWTAPRHWRDRNWNADEKPVVGISWYEAVAFCMWLSEVSGEVIMLPTEDQWKYAAQGEDNRTYPWGDQWDGSMCNNNVWNDIWVYLKTKPNDHGKGTTPVTAYENRNTSATGAIDMAGNVWEWCLTGGVDRTNQVDIEVTRRVLRGGSWNDTDLGLFRCDFRLGGDSVRGNRSNGFRLCRS